MNEQDLTLQLATDLKIAVGRTNDNFWPNSYALYGALQDFIESAPKLPPREIVVDGVRYREVT